MLKWKKLGNIFNPLIGTPRPWMQEYAQCPSPFVLNDKVLRVYITTRGQRDSDMQFVSYPSYVDLSRDDISHIVKIADTPLMPFGNPGSFDEFGITPSSFLRNGDEIYAYYTGWTRMRSVPYTMAIGMAVSRNGGETFEKVGEGPILGISINEPFLLSGPIVRVIEDRWHMWYITGRKWLLDNGKFESVYQIAYASSRDGIIWIRNGTPVIPVLAENECQVSFALFSMSGKWHTIFAYRHAIGFRSDSTRSYRLGYASSNDLMTWERDDSQVGIELSESGWDSQMMCYPQICEVDGRILLFYCGNSFGREGFGIAELVIT